MTDLVVRPYVEEDEPAVRALLDRSLVVSPAGGPPSELFRWKHLENPFGRSCMLVAEAEDRIVGLRAFLRWEFLGPQGPVRAVRAVDTATDPRFQGRGVFSRLTLAGLDAVRGEADFVFNTPNERSAPGYLKMGWQPVGRLPMRIRVRHPLRFLRGLRSVRDERAGRPRPPVSAPRAETVLAGDLGALAEERTGDRAALVTRRDLPYLRWRYGLPPVDYRALGDEGGVVLFRARARGTLAEVSIADLIVRPGDRDSATRLLRAALRAAPSDHMVFMPRAGTAGAAAALRGGYVPARGPLLMVNPLRPGLRPDPTALSSWALSVGDVEVL